MKLFKIQKQHTRPLMIGFLCVLLACIIGGGSTLAYYSASAGEKTNVFSFNDGIRADLNEPNWDPEEGIKLVPGKKVAKDPMITNNCKVPEYAAIKLTFQYDDKTTVMSEADYNRLMNLIVIDWNTGTGEAQWTAAAGANTNTQTYVYNKQLSAGEISTPIFNSIRVKTKADGLTEADLRWLQGIKIENGEIVADEENGLGGLNIKVEGAVVQADAFENPTGAAETLISLFS